MRRRIAIIAVGLVIGYVLGQFIWYGVAHADPAKEQSNGQATAVCPLSKGWNLVAINKTQLNCGTVWIWVP
jgi:hypothetical protein